MGGKPVRPGHGFYFCFALLIYLSGCSMFDDMSRQRQLSEELASGNQLLVHGDFDGSLKTFENVAARANDQPPGDAATYNIGLVEAHPENPKRDRPRAIDAFNRVIARYPHSQWAEPAKVWVSVLSEAEESKKEVEQSKQLVERSQLELERNRQAMEKSKQEIEKSRLELEKSRLEMEKTKQMIEKSKQVDIEIEQKRRERGR
jgi:hypothetical protein